MKKKLDNITIFSAIAIIFVVLQHSNSYYLIKVLGYESYDDSNFLTIMNKVITIAVPMFIFIGGYKYELNRKFDNYYLYVRKKIRTIFKPFFIYSTTIILIFNLISFIINRKVNIFNIINDILKSFLGNNISYQLWYIPMYLLIVLTYPILENKIKRDKSRVLIFIIMCIVSIIFSHTNRFLSTLFEYPYISSFVKYIYIYEFGVLSCRYKSKINIGKEYIYIYIVAIFLVVLLKNNSIVSELFQYLVIYTVGCYAFFYISYKLKKSKMLIYIGKNSFYIYLFHLPIILNLCGIVVNKIFNIKSYYGVIIIMMLSIFISILFYRFLNKFKNYIFIK